MIKSRFQQYAHPSNLSKLPATTGVPRDLGDVLSLNRQLNTSGVSSPGTRKPPSNMNMNSTTGDGLLYAENSTGLFLWNDSATGVGLFNLSANLSDDYPGFEFEIHPKNGSAYDEDSWAFCSEWTSAQHTMFQTAHLFFAAAFLVPMSFKQSVLLVR